MNVFLARHDRREMGYNGPMRSGLVMDARSLLSEGYTDYQAELVQRLGSHHSGDWYAPDTARRGNQMQIDVDTRRGRTIVPGYFVGRLLAKEALADILKQFGLPDVFEVPGDCRLHVQSLDVRLYDMGYGSVTLRGEIEASRDLDVEEYRVAAEKAGSELSQLKSIFMDTFDKIAASVKREAIIANFHGSNAKNEFFASSCLAHGIGDLFWVHRIFSVPCDDADAFAKAKEECKALVFSEQPPLLEDSAINPGMAIYPGNGNSVIVYDRSRIKVGDTGTLSSMIRAQNVFYVAAEDIDRDLFYLGNDLDRQKHSQDMSLLEHQSQVIVEYQSKVTLFKAVYDDFDNSLDPQGLKIWHALEKAWHTRDRFDNLNTKLDLVEKIYNRIRDNLSHLQNKRLGFVMLAFTLISSLSVIVDTVDFTQGGALQTPSALRIGLLAALLTALAFFAARLLKHKKRL